MTAEWDPLAIIRIRITGGTYFSLAEALCRSDTEGRSVDVAVCKTTAAPAPGPAALRRIAEALGCALAKVRRVYEFSVGGTCAELWAGVLDALVALHREPQSVIFESGPYDVPVLYRPPGAEPGAGAPLAFPSVRSVHAATCLDAQDTSFVHLLNYFPNARLWFREVYAYSAIDIALLSCTGRVAVHCLIFDPTEHADACDIVAGTLNESDGLGGPSPALRSFLADIRKIYWVTDSAQVRPGAPGPSAASTRAAASALAAHLRPSCAFTAQLARPADIEYIMALGPHITNLAIADSVSDAMYRKRPMLCIPIGALRDMPKLACIRYMNGASRGADIEELQRRLAWAGDSVSVIIGAIIVRIPSGEDKHDFAMRLYGSLDFTEDIIEPLAPAAYTVH